MHIKIGEKKNEKEYFFQMKVLLYNFNKIVKEKYDVNLEKN